MRLAVSKDGKSFGEPKIVPTPQDFKEGMKLFEQLARELLGDAKPTAVVGGIAGPLDKEHTMLLNSPNIPGWIQKPLKEELEKQFEAPVRLENDTSLAGLGEVNFGAAKGYPIAVYMTISTGVGGARFVDGKIDRSAMGFEPGHQIIDMKGTLLCPGLGCNQQGHLEGYVSGSALKARYQKEPSEITDPAIWDETAKWLAVGLNNTIVHWSPDVVVLGGSMITGDPAISIKAIEKHLKAIMRIFPSPPPIRKGVLGDLGGLYGALELAKQQKFIAT